MNTNRETARNKLMKAYRQALIAVFLVLAALVSIYGIGYVQGDTSLVEGTMTPFASLLVFLCLVAATCRIGASIMEGKRPGKQ